MVVKFEIEIIDADDILVLKELIDALLDAGIDLAEQRDEIREMFRWS